MTHHSHDFCHPHLLELFIKLVTTTQFMKYHLKFMDDIVSPWMKISLTCFNSHFLFLDEQSVTDIKCYELQSRMRRDKGRSS
jgi:hypothetical protein